MGGGSGARADIVCCLVWCLNGLEGFVRSGTRGARGYVFKRGYGKDDRSVKSYSGRGLTERVVDP